MTTRDGKNIEIQEVAVFRQRWVQVTVKGKVSFHTEANEEPTTWNLAMHENPTWFCHYRSKNFQPFTKVQK